MNVDHICSVELFHSKRKLKTPFVISLETLEYAESIYVLIKTKNGYVGHGESCPFKSINGETIDTGLAIGGRLAKRFIGFNALDIEAAHQLMDSYVFGNASIKSAFDIALFDIASQTFEKPLFEYLGGNINKPMFTGYTVSLGEVNEMADHAAQIIAEGFTRVKVKLGDTSVKDLKRVEAIRKAIGENPKLRLDANQGWDLHNALEVLKVVEIFQIEYCEEPIPRWGFLEIPYLIENCHIPIMADESCFSSHDARNLIQLGACNMINIKLGKSAGIYDAIKIAEAADNCGVLMQVGGFLESKLAFTASAHFALSNKSIQYFDFDSPLFSYEDPIIGGIEYKKGGEVILPLNPGLGASVDIDYLRSLPSVSIK